MKKNTEITSSNSSFYVLWSEWKGLILLLILMTIFRSALADWNDVPTGSMKPTIVEGDRIFVNKAAYDIRVPFTNISLIKRADPERGDIIIFDSAVSKIRLVKRVVAVPGDRVHMLNNVLTINGIKLDYETITETPWYTEHTENLLGAVHKIRVNKESGRASSFGPLTVPREFYLALGDNRDNSADSRFIGLIPRNEIVGRTRSVVMSLDYNHYFLPRKDRFLQPL